MFASCDSEGIDVPLTLCAGVGSAVVTVVIDVVMIVVGSMLGEY